MTTDENTKPEELKGLKTQLQTYKELAGLGSGTSLVNESQIGSLIRDLQNKKAQEEANLLNAKMTQLEQQEAFEDRQLNRQQMLNNLAIESNILAAQNSVIQAEIALNTAKQAENKARFNYLEAAASGDPQKIKLAFDGLQIAQQGVSLGELGVANAQENLNTQKTSRNIQEQIDAGGKDKQFVDQQTRRQDFNIEAQSTEERLSTEAAESLNRGGRRDGLRTRFNIDRLNIDQKGIDQVRQRSDDYFNQEMSTDLPSVEQILNQVNQQFEQLFGGIFGENILQGLDQESVTRSLAGGVERAMQIQSGIKPDGMQSQIQPGMLTDPTQSGVEPMMSGQLNTIQQQLDKIHSSLSNMSGGVENLTVVSNDPSGDSRQVFEDWNKYKNYG